MPSTDPPRLPLLSPDTFARWRRAAESSHDGFWERDLRTRSTWFSDSCWALFGLAPDSLPTDPPSLAQRVHPEDAEAFRRAYRDAVAVLGRFDTELRFKDHAERWRWVRVRGRVWPDTGGRAAIVAGVVTDIAQAKRTQFELEDLVAQRTARLSEALNEAERRRAEAQRAGEAQARFLAHMSHELRTPLAGMLGLVELAHRNSADSAQRRWLEVALQSGRALQQVISDVLDMNRLHEGALRLADLPFDLADALAEVMRGVMPVVRRKGLSMRFDWVGERTWVRGDEARLRQIVNNLVDNAAKFTERGHVALRASLDERADGGLQLSVHVEDTGPGMDAATAARAFDDFVQGDASLTRTHGGIGLGLPLSRGLAHRMGGTLQVHDRSGGGCDFELTLPLRPADDPDPLPAPEPGHAWLLYRQADIGQWLQRRLARLGWTSELVPGVEAATLRARGRSPGPPPDLVVVAEHVMTPEPDLDALRAALPDTPIRLLIRPDWDQPRLEARATALGMALDIMPVTPRDLRLMTAGRAAGPAQPRADAPARGADVLVVEDNDVNRLIAEEFVRSLGLPVRSVADGAQALQACQAMPPRLVLMDLQMPVMDGLAATRELRSRQQRGELAAFPIVALTAHAMASDRDACFAAGMDGFLTKPLMLRTLRDELVRWLPELAPTA